MDHITEAFYNVMYQYRLAFTPDGVQANLNQWRQQKTSLLELLRRHPKYITFLAPLVTWFMTVLAGTGHTAFSTLRG